MIPRSSARQGCSRLFGMSEGLKRRSEQRGAGGYLYFASMWCRTQIFKNHNLNTTKYTERHRRGPLILDRVDMRDKLVMARSKSSKLWQHSRVTTDSHK